MRTFFTILFCSLLSAVSFAQWEESKTDQAIRHLTEHYQELGLTQEDISEIVVDHAHTDARGNSFIHLVQSVDKTPIQDAIISIGITKNGKVFISRNMFVANAKDQIKNAKQALSAKEALTSVVRTFNEDATVVQLRSDDTSKDYAFDIPELVNNEVSMKVVYEKTGKNDITLAYDFAMDMKESADYWNVRVDAKTGKILAKHNWTVYCNHGNKKNHVHNCRNNFIKNTQQRNTIMGDGATYKVYAYPTESPIHGNRVTLVDPADEVASPLGWHDTNGQTGAEFTITRGNNVHAYVDSTKTNASQGGEPDGGANLVFSFDHDLNQEPRDNVLAAQTQLFYANNFMHDFSYRLGFDEASGNFQQNNYGNGGTGNDPVNAEALDTGNGAGISLNNASFSTFADGLNGRMSMFLWNNPSGAFSIDAPEELAGFLTDIGRTDTGQNIWGALISQNTVTADIAVVDAASVQGSQPSMGCGVVMNDVTGKVAMIDRGVCEFGTKALNAQNAGAVAVIICNVAGVNGGTGEEILGMAAGDDGGQVSIPVIAMKLSKCNEIKASLASNIDVTVTFEERGPDGANFLDGSFDNGIMAHEYAHGISNRLTGGANNANCLKNFDDDEDGSFDRGEQMGEGWSDYFTLITTLEEGDQGSDVRGIGNFADAQGINGRGIRRFPYSTDMNICPFTYSDIRTGSVPHGVGEPWAAMLWDLTWAMIDQYGLDVTWQDENSGNYRAAKLVVDGMKLQGCDPGYVSGRDGIIFADFMNYQGAHECLIYEVFARRGVGYYANEGSPLDQRDGVENFDPKPTCIAELKVEREITELIKPGSVNNVSVKVINHESTDPVDVLVTEQLPEGLSYVENSTGEDASANNEGVVFSLNQVEYDDERTFEFEIMADPEVMSTRLAINSFEDGSDNYNFELVEGNSIWFNNSIAYEGGTGYSVNATAEEADVSLISSTFDVPSDSDFPALRFWHRYDTETSADGGYVSISTDDGATWQYVSDFIKNGYDGELQYTTFAIPALGAFHGSTNGEWKDSYIDLREYKGQSVKFRWRFGSDDNTNVEDVEFAGWTIDEVELMDLIFYDINTCIGPMDDPMKQCNEVTRIIVDSQLSTSTEEVEDDIYDMKLYPNPVKSRVFVDVTGLINETVQVKLSDINGITIVERSINIGTQVQSTSFDTQDLAAGMYLIQVQSDNGLSTRKFVKN